MTDKPEHPDNAIVPRSEAVDVEISDVDPADDPGLATSAQIAEARAEEAQPEGPSEPLHLGHDAELDDSLADVIADLESRLDMIRETHLEQEMLEVDVMTREGELVVYRDDIAERERALSDEEVELRDREMIVERERDQFLQQRDRLEQRLKDLEELEAALVERAEDQAFESDDLERERATIESTRVEIREEQSSLSTREREVSSRAEQIAAERERIQAAQAALTNDKRVLEEQAVEQQKLASQLEKMRADLAAREDELESRFAEHAELKDMLTNMSAQLEESRAEARKQAEQYESAIKERADDEKRNEDLERRCRTLEAERARIRGELTKVRQELSAAEAHPRPGVAHNPQVVPIKSKRASTRTAEIGGMIWFITMGVAAIGVSTAVGAEATGTGLGALGLGAGLCIFASHALLGRSWDSSALLIAALAATLGLWFPHWFTTVETAATLWDLPAEVFPPALSDRIPMAFAAGTAALAMAVCLFLLTGASGVLGHAIFGAIIATSVLMVPNQSIQLQALAAMLWLAIVSASLVKWAVRTHREESGIIA